MLYHTAMIILHRPPRQSFGSPNISSSKDVEICYASLEATIKLLRIYSRQHNYRNLPFTFVHILASTASVILMKLHISNIHWEDVSIARPLETVLEALDSISHTWPCAIQVRGVIDMAIESSSQPNDHNDSLESFDFMAGLSDNSSLTPLNFDMNFGMTGDDLGLFDPSSFLGAEYQWNDELFS